MCLRIFGNSARPEVPTGACRPLILCSCVVVPTTSLKQTAYVMPDFVFT